MNGIVIRVSERLEQMVEQLITLVSKTQQDMHKMQQNMQEFRHEIKEDMQELRHELKEDIKIVKKNTAEIAGDIRYLKFKVSEHDAAIYKLKQKLID